jgi:hypothetical protein
VPGHRVGPAPRQVLQVEMRDALLSPAFW